MTGRTKRKVPGRPFKKGNPGGPGRPPKNPLQKAIDAEIRQYAKQKCATFKEACDSLLPIAVDRVHEALERKGTSHEANHVRILESLSDRVFGRPAQAITGSGGGPMLVAFSQLIGGVDGAKTEKFAS